jgi:hypothetical protein
MEKIAVWADYTWCFDDEELEEMTKCMSDDYMLIKVPESIEDIDQWLQETRPQG